MPPMMPTKNGAASRQGDAVMRIDDGAELVGRRELGNEAGRYRRRHGQHHGLVLAERLAPGLEAERVYPAAAEIERAQAGGEAHRGRRAAQMRERRIDERLRQPLPRHERPARIAAPGEGLGHDARQHRRRRLAGGGIEGGDRQGPPEAAEERRLAAQHCGDGAVVLREGEADRAEILRQPRSRDAAVLVEDPPRHAAARGRSTQRSPVARSRKGKAGSAGPVSVSARADRREIGHRRAVALQQQMIAVVDAAAERRIEIRAAASAGLRRCLMENHGNPGIGKPHRCGEPGEPRADDMHARKAAHNSP